MKKKKEIEIPKNKYIYQRYDGIITKYIVNNEYYIAVGTEIATKKDETVLLGKVAENIIDLIEVGDFVNGYGVIDFYLDYFNGNDRREKPKRIAVIVDKFCDNHIKEDEIKTILTHEQFEQNCYTVKSSTIN